MGGAAVNAERTRIGVDIGGTFTDLVGTKDGRVVGVHKIPTTPADPSRALADGIKELVEQLGHGRLDAVVHGTTLIPNALIERKGAKVALIATAGFRDTLEIGREHRYDIYDLFIEVSPPLVPRRRRWEVAERILADGGVDTELDEAGLDTLIERIRSEAIESVAICLLHSYRNDRHERRVAERLASALPELPLSISSQVVPEIDEYVRVSTTVVNAYVQPLCSHYLARISERLEEIGVRCPFYVMLSTGGLADVETVRSFPVRITESGPAAGVISATHSALLSGFDEILAFDMGGTTAKACIAAAGTPLIAPKHEVARVHRFAQGSGLPVQAPVVDLIEIGAGGGSIASVDRFGLPVVGPESAGADPGPACYGRDGGRPTVTDADLLLGYLDPDYFLGGKMRLDREAAQRAMGALAERLDLDTLAAAAAVHRVVNENMAAAARIHGVERGRDVTSLTLVATGGAGPVHAWGVAGVLGISTVLYPPSAGVASAFGLLVARPAFEVSRSAPILLAELDDGAALATLREMRDEGVRPLSRLSVAAGQERCLVSVDMRFEGQGDPLAVEVGRLEDLDRPSEQLGLAFRRDYVELFGREPSGVEIEIVTWRLRVETADQLLAEPRAVRTDARIRPPSSREIWVDEKRSMVTAPVVDRYCLAPGDELEGPAVIEERESTAVITGSARISVDEGLNLIAERII